MPRNSYFTQAEHYGNVTYQRIADGKPDIGDSQASCAMGGRLVNQSPQRWEF
jgi:hypothetical protein